MEMLTHEPTNLAKLCLYAAFVQGGNAIVVVGLLISLKTVFH